MSGATGSVTAAIEAAVNDLAERERLVFLAHAVDGTSYAAIAASHGIAITDVEQLLASALVQLAAALDRIERHDRSP
jgi:DNA-directed RNA polymerase specialized sigma24 family protein